MWHADFLSLHFDEILTIVKPLLVVGILFQVLPLLVLAERRGAAFIQDRIGPNRAALTLPFAGGFRLRGFGMLFNIADLIKLMFKENFQPTFAHRWTYIIAPAIPVLAGVLTPAVIPWFAPILHADPNGAVHAVSGQVLDANAGLLVLFAIGSLSVYGIVLGSWSSNSKYSLLGGMRASAMMISYEVSMGLSVLGVILLVGDFSLTRIVSWQAEHAWGIFVQPVGFLLFLISMFAECNRNPFDVAEGESELVAGFHTEYASTKFMCFMTGEYLHVLVASLLIATLFLGGYDLVPLSNLLAHVPESARFGIPAGPYDAAFIAAHLGGIAALFLLPGSLVLALASALVAGRQRAYAHLKASDLELRRREYGFFSALFMFLAVLLAAAGFACLLLVTTSPVPGAFWQGTPVYPLWVNLVVAFIQLNVVIVKALLVSWLFIWVRWTLPRFRYDQIMSLGWKVMINIALLNLVVTAIIAKALS
jgi:NADH-quinone oxidoreductase subunit H